MSLAPGGKGPDGGRRSTAQPRSRRIR